MGNGPPQADPQYGKDRRRRTIRFFSPQKQFIKTIKTKHTKLVYSKAKSL